MNTTTKFDGRAKDYAAGRPTYSAELVCWLRGAGIEKSSVIADVGSGTGKFSKCLLDEGCKVFAVEPNSDMRAVAEADLRGNPDFFSVSGSAENTTLPCGSVDFVTVAQAFHWFDGAKFRRECLRILKKSGKVFLIWNSREPDAPLNLEWSGIASRYCPDFRGFGNGIRRGDEKIKAFFGEKYDYAAFDYPLIFTKEGFIKRCLSSSYSLTESDESYGKYLESLLNLFDKYAKSGILSVPNRSVVYCGVLR